jgi:alginate biosynthesis protein Alg44
VKCLWEGVQVPVVDISVGGLGLRSEALEAWTGRVLDLTLVFPFNEYELTLPIRAEIRYVNKEHNRLGLRFTDVSPRQHNLLRFILDAYLSGEVVEAGDVLDVVSRRNEGKTREVPQRENPEGLLANFAQYGRSVAGYGAIGIATLLLVGFVGTSIFERMYIIPAQSAMITADLVTVPAPANGQLTFVASKNEVQMGEPLLTLQGAQGSSIVIDSPCDCLVQTRYSRASSFVREGLPVLVLREKTSTPYISASISEKEVLRFYRGAKAIIEYADGTLVRDAQFERLPTLAGENDGDSRFLVKLAPGRELETSMIGQPVSVVFDTFSGSSLSVATNKLQASLIWAGSQIAAVFNPKNEVAGAPDETSEPKVDGGKRLAGLKSE